MAESHDAELAHEVELAAVVFGELAACLSSGFSVMPLQHKELKPFPTVV